MKQQSKICAYCGGDFIPERRNGMYCSPTCRQYSYIKRKTGEAPYDRVKQKEAVNLELQSVPPLVIEEAKKTVILPAENENKSLKSSENNQFASNKTVLETVELMPTEKVEINAASKEKTLMNNNQSNNKLSNSVARNNVPYEKLLAEEKEFFNDQLGAWWNYTFGEKQEKLKLIGENQDAKKFIRQILAFDGKENTLEDMQNFLMRMHRAINNPTKESSDFIYGHTLVGEASVQPAIFLKQLDAAGKTTGIFRIVPEIRPKLEVMLQFINEFTMRTPEHWELK
ncbi:MAG TPA: hypothetical protein VNZ49_09105 [Bacteroidia bacterium]|jgi:hypothetical protein|nr:hypothetical protein [Bacteroidia bacterium]